MATERSLTLTDSEALITSSNYVRSPLVTANIISQSTSDPGRVRKRGRNPLFIFHRFMQCKQSIGRKAIAGEHGKNTIPPQRWAHCTATTSYPVGRVGGKTVRGKGPTLRALSQHGHGAVSTQTDSEALITSSNYVRPPLVTAKIKKMKISSFAPLSQIWLSGLHFCDPYR